MDERSETVDIRYGQLFIVIAFAAYFGLVVFGNLTDYGTNLAFVKHVMSMDTVPVGSDTHWRALYNPVAHYVVFDLMIVWESATALLCAAGALRAARHLSQPDRFSASLSVAITGLWLGLALWLVAFLIVGGEWFQMWQSAQWSGEATASRMATLNSLAILLTLQRPRRG